MYLMIKFARLGPSSLHTGKYYFEKSNAEQDDIVLPQHASGEVQS